MKYAVCVLIVNNDAERLSVSRRNDTTRWGYPGGKVDKGESNLHAIIREVREETGITLDSTQLIPLYSGMCFGKDGNHFWTTTYLYGETINDISSYTPEEGIEMKFVDPKDMTNSRICPFADYNMQVEITLEHFVDFWEWK
ncbi:MAG TPA: NUDIX hydrolase [Methanosarcina sp.]|nr:NUDIX hydrolase [Methanosarcina sp.]